MDSQPTIALQAPRTHSLVLGLSAAMQLLNEMVHEIARTDIPVLIVGESGTGKDAYARQIHRLSHRSEMRFHKFNCAANDSGPLHSQLRQLRNEAAGAISSGTLYLDNLQELDPSVQRVLLACLADGEESDSNPEQGFRLVSSATSSLEADVELNHFRRELYFRLNGACLRVPPLRERVEDIHILTEHFLAKYSTAYNKKAPHLNQTTTQALSEYRWPGNVRELENLIRKAVLFGDFQSSLKQLQLAGPGTLKQGVTTECSSLKVAARTASKKAERELILLALERTHWNRKRAARDLQISYKSLLYKIKQIGVSEGKQKG